MVLLALLTAAMADAKPPSWPRFSWDTVPVFYHSCNFTGPYTDAGVKIMAKFPMVTIEKGQGVTLGSGPGNYAEDKIVDTLRRIKAIDDNISTIFYYNSILDWPFYKLHADFVKHPDWWLKGGEGDVCRIGGDGSFPNHTNMLVFDFAQKAVRDFWASECVNMTQTGFVDGCFSDRSPSNDHDMSAPCGAGHDFAAGHVTVLQDLQRQLGNGVLIANHAYNLSGVNAVQIEGFKADEASIRTLQQCVANGKITEAHAGYGEDGTEDNHCVNGIENSLAAFLIGAGSRSYYTCSRGWKIQEDPVEKAWHPEYDKPLGAPVADGVKGADGIWRRSFKSAKGETKVVFDPKSKNPGSIWWAGEPAPPPPPPPPPPQPPASCSAPSTFHNHTGIANDDLCWKTASGCPQTTTAKACCELCAADPQCKAFCWYSEPDSTQLAFTAAKGTADNAVVAGTPCHLHSSWDGHWTKPGAARISGMLRPQ